MRVVMCHLYFMLRRGLFAVLLFSSLALGFGVSSDKFGMYVVALLTPIESSIFMTHAPSPGRSGRLVFICLFIYL